MANARNDIAPFSWMQYELHSFTYGKQWYFLHCIYRISGIFRVGLIFAEFATSLKSPKIDTAKNKPYDTSSLRVLGIAIIGLNENLTHLSGGIFAKISRCEKFPIYDIHIFIKQLKWIIHLILKDYSWKHLSILAFSICSEPEGHKNACYMPVSTYIPSFCMFCSYCQYNIFHLIHAFSSLVILQYLYLINTVD